MTTAASTVNLHTSESTTLNTRAAFITRTYLLLLGAILGFILVELFLFSSGLSKPIAEFLLSVPWLGVLTAFSVVGWLATKTAGSVESKAAQYVALTGFVLAEALIFVPILYIAQNVAPGIIETSAVVTCLAFLGLSAIAFTTKKNFSFLRGGLMWAGVVALILIVAGELYGFQLGTLFSVGMIAVAGFSILYDTSEIIHEFDEDGYVGASLQLFGSVALLFWYVLRLLIAMVRRD